jgi:hypothetical protein
MSIKSTKTPSTTQPAARPQAGREEPPVRWPSVATSGGAAYVSHPEPKVGPTGAEG